MDANTLFVRLALQRGWISRDVHDEALARVRALQRRGFSKSVEDVLREGRFLDEKQLRVLRRILSRFTKEARIGDYTIRRRIGVGGMGIVFEASHRRPGQTVALKVLFPRFEKAPGVSARFLREAKILARVDHPNVVHAYDAGKDGDFCYIAMELVDGTDLSRHIEQLRAEGGGGSEGRPLSVEETLGFMLPVARALDAIHRAGLLHRDVKPANILISSDGVKLVDLGLFFADVDRRVLWDGMVVGTPQYMSPEQIRGDPKIDVRSDLYSFGVTWYYALTERTPFDVDSPTEVVHAHLEVAPIPPSRRRPDLPEWLDDLVLGLLSKDPAERPQSAGELISTLEAIEHGGATEVRPPAPRLPSEPPWRQTSGSVVRAGRSKRLSTSSALLVGGLFLAIVVGLAFGMTLFRKTSEEKVMRQGAPPQSPVTAVETSDDGGIVNETVSEGDSGKAERNIDVLRLHDPSEAVRNVRIQARKIVRHTFRVLRVVLGSLSPWGSRLDGAPVVQQPHLPLPPAVEHWARSAAREVEQSFGDRLLEHARGGRTVRLSLVTGESEVLVQATPDGFRLVDASSPDREILPTTVQPISVLIWGALSRGRMDLGVGYLLSVRHNVWARTLLRRFDPALPPEVKRFAQSSPESLEPTVEEMQGRFERTLSLLDRVLQARRAQEKAQWDVAHRVLSSLSEEVRLPAAFEDERGVWLSGARRAHEYHWLTEVCFNGRAKIRKPGKDFDLTVKYSFEEPRELEDFRFRAGRWELRQGRLVAVGRGLGQAIDTVAIFRLPVIVEGDWGSSEGKRVGRLAIYFEEMGIGLGGPHGEMTVFKAGSAEEKTFRRGDATGVGGPFRIELDETRIRGSFSDVRIDTPLERPLLPFGRLAVQVEARFELEGLSITGPLEERWVRARFEAMNSEPTAGRPSTH